MHRSKWCNRKRFYGSRPPWWKGTNVIGCTCDCTHIKNCCPLQKFFTSFFVHHPSRIKDPKNQKHPQFHPVINGHGNKRLRSWAHRIVAWHTTTLHHFSGNWPPISTTQGWKSRLGFQQHHRLEIGAQFEPGTGGIEPPTFCLQAWAPTNYAKFGWPAHPYKSVCYIATPARPPKSKLQNPKSKRAVWILDFGFWILDFGFWILDLGFWILDFGFWILDFGSWILDFGFWILDFGSWILDFGSWILDFGLS